MGWSEVIGPIEIHMGQMTLAVPREKAIIITIGFDCTLWDEGLCEGGMRGCAKVG